MSESRVTWPTSVTILVFLGLSVLDLGPTYATDTQMSQAHHRLMPPPYGGAGIKSCAGGRHNMPRPLQVDLWPFYLESGVRITCDVGYLCANFSLPRPLCYRLRPDIRDRQTDVRRASSVNAPTL